MKWKIKEERIMKQRKQIYLNKITKSGQVAINQCPECEGTNLNENATVCWDCHASDYAG